MGKLIIKNRYGTIPNDLLNSSKISFKAKGLYAFIQSKPDNWEFSAERISKQVKEGLPSVVSALKELETFGYLVRQRYQNNKGFWVVDYLLYEIPIKENLITGKPNEENPNIGKPSNNSNKDFSNKEYNNYTNNKEIIVKRESDFNFFWDCYNKKLDRSKCEKTWNKLSSNDIDNILFTIEDYVNANQDIKFRKNPSTYLNNKCWNDEIIYHEPLEKKGKHQKNFENLYSLEQKLLKEIEDGTFNNPFSRK
jgi:hypothetical protein